MVKIRIVCVGSMTESFFRQAQQEYLKRLGRFCKTEIIEVPDEKAPAHASASAEAAVRAKEGERLLGRIADREKVIALDLAGKRMTSPGLAKELAGYCDAGERITFVIGGSLGLSQQVLNRADAKWCLSELTFTHNMARLILLEQLYRGFKINANEPYHK